MTSNSETNVGVQVYDTIGHHGVHTPSHSHQGQFSMANTPTGMYLVGGRKPENPED